MMMLLMLVGLAAAQERRDWKALRNNRNNEVQLFEPIPMFNNFRKPQPIGEYRKVYKTADATGQCLASCDPSSNSTVCVKPEPTRTKRRRAYTNFFHWDYADQRRWFRWIHPMKWENECLAGSTGPTQWGESPINIEPSTLETINVGFDVSDDAYIELSDGWFDQRPFLFVNNNGHSVQLTVCGNNIYDCKARARFGDWPCRFRGANCSNDEYILAQLHFHWGEDSSKGSEHQMCGSPRPAEMHMVFLNSRWGDPEDPVPWDLDLPERGVRLLVMGTFIETNGDGPDNPFFAPILDAVRFPEPRYNRRSFRDRGVAHWANSSGPSQGPIDLSDMLPEDFATKFFTYPGSLTTPPCSQFVSWFVFENAVKWSEKQLDQLREATTYYHFPHTHPHYYAVILFACVMLILGTVTKQFLERYAPTIPYTMVVMMWGFLLNFLASTNNDGQLNPMQQSLRMWSNIDGHLALYVFIPALLFGDVMKLNMRVFMQTIKQAIFLAGPAVLASTYLTGFVIKYLFPYGWSWTFCLTIGAILAATDPVAVLTLMKSLGAPKGLSMQMNSESLLNDGTAVILFTVFFDMSRKRRGQYASVARLFRIGTRMVFFSPCLGFLVGAVAVYWMSRASRRHAKADALVQLSITLIAAYLSFFLADNSKIGQASGILATVAAALVLAYRVWPIVISKEAMENVWSTLEHILNTLIFGLVGVQMSRGKLSHNVNWREVYWAFVLYVAVMLIRAVIIGVSVPIINCLGPYKVGRNEASFMILGGLRGVVSLSLAIFVKQKRSNTIRTWPDDDDHDAERTLFLVGGVAFFTLLINAPLSHPMLKAFKLTAGTDKEKAVLLDHVRDRVVESAEKAYKDTCLRLRHDAVEVTRLCRNLANVDTATPVADKFGGGHHDVEGGDDFSAAHNSSGGYDVYELEAALQSSKTKTEQGRLPTLRETFLSIVHAQYWRMIEVGELPKTAHATITLLRSIDIAKERLDLELHDYGALKHLIRSTSVRGSPNDRLFNAVDNCTPDWFTFGSEVFYQIEFERYEVVYYVLRAYAIAHAAAQKVFVDAVFGSDVDFPNRPEELAILLESARLVQIAEDQHTSVSPNLKSIVKSKIVAESVLEAQRETVYKLVQQGVIAEVDTDPIALELDEDERHVTLARKAQAKNIAKIATLNTVRLKRTASEAKIFGLDESPEERKSNSSHHTIDEWETPPQTTGMKRNTSQDMLFQAVEQQIQTHDSKVATGKPDDDDRVMYVQTVDDDDTAAAGDSRRPEDKVDF